MRSACCALIALSALAMLTGCGPREDEYHAVGLPWRSARDYIAAYHAKLGTWPESPDELRGVCNSEGREFLDWWDSQYGGGFELTSESLTSASYAAYSRNPEFRKQVIVDAVTGETAARYIRNYCAEAEP